jgi:hypothetical protein
MAAAAAFAAPHAGSAAIADVAAMAALRALAIAARDPDAGSAAAHQPMLRLRVRLRAAADDLVCRAGSDVERAATRAACTVFLSLVFRPSSCGSGAGGAASTTATSEEAASGTSGIASAQMEAICRRSERYVGLASQSVALVTSHALRHLRELISAAPPPSAAYNELIVGEWMAWRSGRRACTQTPRTDTASGAELGNGLGSDGVRRGGVASGGLGCVLTFGYSPHVTRLLATAAATEHFTVRLPPHHAARPSASAHFHAGATARVVIALSAAWQLQGAGACTTGHAAEVAKTDPWGTSAHCT